MPSTERLNQMPTGFPGDTREEGNQGSQQGIQRPIPSSARVIHGTLYTLNAPWRVVAIGTAKEEAESGSTGTSGTEGGDR